MIADYPKLLGQPEALASRIGQLDESHIAPLTDFVGRLRERMGPLVSIPYFDPWDGGINAKVLFLLEAPGPKARNSGFISINNPDETAKNLFELLVEAGIERRLIVLWNVVPWYLGSERKIRAARSGDVQLGIESVNELMALLQQVRGVVLVGRKAQKAESYLKKLGPTLFLESCPHPSPMYMNRKPENRLVLLQCLRKVSARLKENQ